jgi:hypothetical protein
VVRFMHCLPVFHDTNTVTGREFMEHAAMTVGFEVKAVPVAALA